MTITEGRVLCSPLNIGGRSMEKVKLKHRENGKQMNEVCLKAWIKEGVNEGLGAYSIQDALEKMFDVGKIKQLLIESLTPEMIIGNILR